MILVSTEYKRRHANAAKQVQQEILLKNKPNKNSSHIYKCTLQRTVLWNTEGKKIAVIEQCKLVKKYGPKDPVLH
jgi:hypothetical protein